ncbi:Ca2+-dependent phosphoinositide-specific phospholipase C [Streptomyces niveus]|uniref:Ca2+-dependent phosphoinositide-specific phospholipase C n=1 Tax=Streptomyces niveus TaxID=193462 RepID=UPI003415C0B7
MIELDTWPDTTTKQWRVSHSDPHRNVNNCTPATTPAQLYSGSTHSNLETCLDDVRIWLRAHPGAGPLVVKLELKAGFATGRGMGPSQLDALIVAHLGATVFRPADLLAKPAGGSYATAADAARAGNWPTRSELAGRVLLYAIPGAHTRHPDIELGRHLRDLAATDNIGRAQVFPAVHGATAGDPRTAYKDTAIRPWFVVFDGDATTYLDHLNTTWYDTNHYLLTMTDAHKVTPAISTTRPTPTQALARTQQLAAAHATIVSSDWRQLPDAQSLALPRGHPPPATVTPPNGPWAGTAKSPADLTIKEMRLTTATAVENEQAKPPYACHPPMWTACKKRYTQNQRTSAPASYGPAHQTAARTIRRVRCR